MSLISWIRKLLGLGRPGRPEQPASPVGATREVAATPARPSADQGKTPVDLTVGLDFGTSTVKCVVQAAVGERRRRERHVIPVHGKRLFPSIAWEWDGGLTIGRCPHPDAHCYRSVKVCLRCPLLPDEPCRRCFDNSDLTAEVVSWAMLSHSLASIRRHIKELYPEQEYSLDWRKNVEWNMGVPLDGLEQQALRGLFRDLLWKAVHFGDGIAETTPCADLVDRYTRLEGEHCPPRHSSNCFVLPEADVAVNAFLEAQRNIENGLYFICDVGAGTTDISFFRFDQNGVRPIVFYGTSSTRIGVDDFASVVAERLERSTSHKRRDSMLAEAHKMLVEGLDKVDLGPSESNGQLAAFRRVYKRLEKGRKKAFGRAWSKERCWEHWKGLRAALIGGGKSVPGVDMVVRQAFSYGNPQEAIAPDMIPLRIPVLPGATELHGIAYGLSIPVAEYYEHWAPDEVAEMAQSEVPYDDPSRYVDYYD